MTIDYLCLCVHRIVYVILLYIDSIQINKEIKSKIVTISINTKRYINLRSLSERIGATPEKKKTKQTKLNFPKVSPNSKSPKGKKKKGGANPWSDDEEVIFST